MKFKHICTLALVLLLLSCFVPTATAYLLLPIDTASDNGYFCVKATGTETHSDGYLTRVKDTFTYDGNGNEIKHIHYESSTLGDFEKEASYSTYDSDGNLRKVISAWKDSENSNSRSAEFWTYDAAGIPRKNVSLEKYEDGDYEKEMRLFFPDDSGQITKMIQKTVEKTGKTVETHKYRCFYTYDSHGEMRSEVITDYATKKVLSTTNCTYIYDQNGRITKETMIETDADGSISKWVSSYVYDSKGNVIKEVSVDADADGCARKINRVYTYDAKGNLKKYVESDRVSGYDSADKTVRTFAYDKHGNPIHAKEAVRHSEGDAIVSKWSFTFAKG